MEVKDVNTLAKIIWDYHHMNHKLEKADLILVLGSLDIRVADRGAELFLDGYADRILFSGGIAHKSDLLKTSWDNTEADQFAAVAISKGVPEDKILFENRTTNTGDNIKLSYDVIQKNNLDVKRMILVQKPYMERRTYATFMKQWPGGEIDIMVTSPQLSFEEYFENTPIDKDTTISLMVGDLQRIKLYPEMGYQIYQEIPEDVLSAYEELVKLGYTRHLLKQ